MMDWLLKLSGASEERPTPITDWIAKIAGTDTPPGPPPEGPRPCCVFPNDESLFWGMDNIPVKSAVTHFAIVGAPGSGKTVSIQLFLQSIAHRFLAPPPGRDPERLIIFDPKRDILSCLGALGLKGQETVTILNPFDKRSVPWDISKDITSQALAQYFAALFIPEDKQSNAPFFWQSAREVVEATITGLMATRPGDWTLRDLLNALATKERISAIVQATPRAKAKADPYLRDQTHFPSILSTIASKIGRFEVIAALWHNTRNRKPFSVADWLKGHGVLVLGNHPTFRESIAPINSLLLRVIAGHVLSGPEVRTPRTWVVLDEFRWMQQVECIQELLNQGRSKGVSVMIGIQDIEGLKVVYGDHAANELLGQCANKTFLRVGSHSTAEWAEKHFALKEEMEVKHSYTHGIDGSSSTQSYDMVTRPLFLQGQFLGLSDPVTGIFAGIHDIPILGGPVETRELSESVFSMLRQPAHDVPNDDPRPAEDQHFDVWTEEEATKFLSKPEAAPEPLGKAAQGPEESPSTRIHNMRREDLFGYS